LEKLAPPGPKGEKGDTGPPGEPYPGFQTDYDFQSGTWNTIKTWTGSASKYTELFSVPSRQMKISWDLNPSQKGIFYLYLHEQGGEFFEAYWQQIQTEPKGDTMAYVDPGAYYLYIETFQCEYSITVEVYVPP